METFVSDFPFGYAVRTLITPFIAEDPNNTEEALSKNVWGSPTFIYNNELFWGQDRIDFLERAIQNN